MDLSNFFDLHNHDTDGEHHDTCPGCALLDRDPTARQLTVENATDESSASAEVPTARQLTVQHPVAAGYAGPIPLDLILVDPADNHARGCRDLKEGDPRIKKLAGNLEDAGQQHPVRVRLLRKPIDGKHYRLVFGFRRTTAAKALGWKEIRAEVVDASDAQATWMNWAEGCREAASRYDLAVGFSLAKKAGYPLDKFARSVGQDPSDAISLARIIDRCPQSLLEIYRNDCSERTTRILDEISQIDEGSEAETHRAMVDLWNVRREEEYARLNPPKPKPKVKKAAKTYVRRTLSLSEVDALQAEIDSGHTWYDPTTGVRPFTEETRSLAAALLRAFRRNKIHIR